MFKGREGIYISNPYNIFYLTNFAEFLDKVARVFITKNSAYLFFDGREEGQLANIYPSVKTIISYKLKENLKKIIKQEKIKKVLIESRELSIYEYEKLKRFKKGIKLKKTDNLVENLRRIKDQEEIKKIRKACILTDKAFQFIKRKIKVGQTEKQVAYILDDFIRRNGGKLAFSTIVASGPNSANIHHQVSLRKIKAGEPVLIDFGAKIENYCADLTRTIFLEKVPEEFENIYSMVLKAQKKAISLFKKEKDSFKIDKTICELMVGKGFGDFNHGLGHSIGLEVHEAPRLSPRYKDILREGEVMTVEPGIYIKGKGGVRIEDDVLIKKNSYEVFTKAPKSLNSVIIR